MKLRIAALVATIAMAGIAVTGCSLANGAANENRDVHTEHAKSNYSDSDIMFAQMMIPHHQQAVDMGTLAETSASNPEVKALAAQIKKEQGPEISQMKGWLKEAHVGLDMGHEMPMDGMLSKTEFEELESATGSAFDKLYLKGMIGHHEGALVMAKPALQSSNPNVIHLGELIVASQTKQIAFMKVLLAKLG